MKTRLRILKPFVHLCSIFAATVVFGQTTYTWTNAADGGLATSNNWNPHGLPGGLPSPGDTAQWDGVTAGPLTITYGTSSLPNTGGFTFGVRFVFTSNQVSSVNFTSTASAFPGSALLGINNISIASGAGAVTFGNSGGPGPGNTFLLRIVTRPSGSASGPPVIHNFLNNSANPATINGDVSWLAGGGTMYVLDFDGTGNWMVNNYLLNDNGGLGVLVQKDGAGTMTWTPTGYLGNSAFSSPAITINAGTLVLAGSHSRLGSQAIVNNATFQFNAPAQSQTLSGVISGGGLIQVSNGMLTLAGANTYSGTTLLSGGTLIAGSAENVGVSGPLGVGGTITFNGGTLGFSVNNVLDASRFSTAAGQAYRFDTGGQEVTFTNGLSSSGGTLTKLGAGTLTLAGANTYDGTTTISAGKLVIQGTKTGTGNIAVGDSAALTVFTTGTQVTPATLTVGTGSTLEFENVSSTTTPPLAAGTVSVGGPISININSGPLAPGSSYPLLGWTSGSAPPVSLGILNGFIGNLSTNGNRIQLNVTATAYKWTGNNNDAWDLVTPNNWQQNGGSVVFAGGGPVLFDDTAATNQVTIDALVQPTTVIVSNNSIAYHLISSGGNNLAGSAGLTKQGSGSLTLAGGANTYTGITTISGGTLSVGALANGGTASDIGSSGSSASNLVLDGGTLQYTGTGASSDRSFTLGINGGAIDASGSGALSLSNPGSLNYTGGGAPRSFALTGTSMDDNILVASIADNGGATTLTKSGPGKWVLTGSNTYSGGTMIADGTLQAGAGGTSGSLGSGSVTNNGRLIFNRSDNLTNNGAISGNGSLVKDGAGTLILPTDNSYAGGTTISNGTLQLGVNGGTGKLNANGAITNYGALVFNNFGSFALLGPISGTGSLTKSGFGSLTLAGANTYTGSNIVNGGTLLVNSDNHAIATLVNTTTPQSGLGGTGTLYGPVTLKQGAALSPGGVGSIGTLTVNNDMSLTGGNLNVKVNKSLSQSNDFVVVTGLLTNSGPGLISVANLGPALQVGDKFTLFSQPLPNGGAFSFNGGANSAGATWTNNLAVDGSVSVTKITRPTLNFTQTGGNLQFSWNTSFGTYRLQSQTNNLAVGLSTNWSDYPGGGTGLVTVPMDAMQDAVFFRLVSTP